MKLLLWSNHRYAAASDQGSGRTPRELPSGSGHYLHDILAQGLAELGHEVCYYLEGGAEDPLPEGVALVAAPPPRVDLLHNYSSSRSHRGLMEFAGAHGLPWVATCHLDIAPRGIDRSHAGANWIFVSETLARLYGRKRFVYNGLNPSHYVFSERRGDYLLFMANMDWAAEKGLRTAFDLAREGGWRLVVAGTSGEWPVIGRIQQECDCQGAEYVGDVRGQRKAELLAGARALLHPTALNEAFGLVMAEALMSGTPVICSDRGACPEVITPEVGFVCREPGDYRHALAALDTISRRACRAKAEREYHYLRMAEGFLREYRAEIAAPSARWPHRDLAEDFAALDRRGPASTP